MADEEGVVIVDSSGTEHHFPAGFDPKKAGGIVRYRTQAHPPSAEDFAPKQRDVSVGNVLLNAVKSLNPVPGIKVIAADQRPEDATWGPAGAVLGPLAVPLGVRAVRDERRDPRVKARPLREGAPGSGSTMPIIACCPFDLGSNHAPVRIDPPKARGRPSRTTTPRTSTRSP
jgi:hypothetical protein